MWPPVVLCAGDSRLPNTLITLADPRQLQAPTRPQPPLCQQHFRPALHTLGQVHSSYLLFTPLMPSSVRGWIYRAQTTEHSGRMSRRSGAHTCPMETTEYRLDPVAHLQSKSRVHPRSHKDRMEPFGIHCLTHNLVFCLQIHWVLCLNEHRR